MSTGKLAVLVALLAIQLLALLVAISEIGKPRQPRTPQDGISLVIGTVLSFAALIYLAIR